MSLKTKRSPRSRTRTKRAPAAAPHQTHCAEVAFFPEPSIRFRHDQALEDPRDGLTLFGPLEHGSPHGMRVGVIGTPRGLDLYRSWVTRMQGPLFDKGDTVAHPPFPGFEAAFRVPWPVEPILKLVIPEADVRRTVYLKDRHQRVFQTVGLFVDRILAARDEEDASVDFWFVVVPDAVFDYCRPKSYVPGNLAVSSPDALSSRQARTLWRAPSLFDEENEAAATHRYEVDFHDQLKVRMLPHHLPTQLALESKLMLPKPGDPPLPRGRDKTNLQAEFAWTLSTAAFYKAGGRPWKIDAIREGVCYVGLVFKQDLKHPDPRTACCAAQMFLDSGDGVVFRGAVGPWHTRGKSDFHLSRDAARRLVAMAVDAYERKTGAPPKELFLHGKTYFNEDEWGGFREAINPSRTNVVGVRIRHEYDLRLYRLGDYPLLRGTALLRDGRSAFLWTTGLSPRLKTYVGREVPRPLQVSIIRGNADLKTVLSDILALTKLNYNSCVLGDGQPVTLRFADHVGEVLTAGPLTDQNPLPFKLYI